MVKAMQSTRSLFGAIFILGMGINSAGEASVVKFIPKNALKKQRIKTSGTGVQTNACAIQIARIEREKGIPKDLLQSIGIVESGRRTQSGEVVAWPWTSNVEGKGYYYETKTQAIEHVRTLQKKGVKSIDVGCMQVNLRHHPEAFKDLEAAFDPRQNVLYAADYLNALKKEHKNWGKAVAHYHSSNPTFHIPYHNKVMARWNPKHPALTEGKQPRIRLASATPAKRVLARNVKHVNNGKILMASSRPAIRKVGRNGKIQNSTIQFSAPYTKGQAGIPVRKIVSKR